MKMLTLNAHSLMEENYEQKLGIFLEFILREQPDIIALQEVNQRMDATIVWEFHGMVPVPGVKIPLKQDNHALRIAMHLEQKGIPVSWAYLPMKLGYGRYDEGVAVMRTNGKITAVDSCTISEADDYLNWRTRKVLGVQVDDGSEWFYSMHMGWWQDEKEPFAQQWQALERHIAVRKESGRIWLMGDFNSPAEFQAQGYDLIAASGWKDSFHLAGKRDGSFTVGGIIDGWHKWVQEDAGIQGMRMDHIWVNESVPMQSWRTVFDGRHEPVVSDHYGILICSG